MEYSQFIHDKRSKVKPSGIEVSKDNLPKHLFPYQRDLVSSALKAGKFCLWADTGLGKALKNGTRVLTDNGWVPIESLKIGDAVANDDGSFYPVMGVYPQGERVIYRITFSDKTTIDCDVDHLWSVVDGNTNGFKFITLSTRQMIERGIRKGMSYKYFIPLTKPVIMPPAPLPIDPYTLGVLIGDGCFRSSSISVTTDTEILDSISLPPETSFKQISVLECKYAVSGYITYDGNSKQGGRNALLNALRDIGLHGILSKDKFIPRKYLFASVSQRWNLLQGLMDTDGSFNIPRVNESGVLSYCTTSKQLCDGVKHLVQSLGGTCSVGIELSPKYHYKGEYRYGSDAYRLVVKLPPSLGNPFRLERKAIKYNPGNRVRNPYRSIHSIKYVGVSDATCISVASPNRLFIADEFIVTHNTSMQLSWGDALISHSSAKKIILLAPLGVSKQTINEGNRFGFNVKYCEDQNDVIDGINVTNYERLHKFDTTVFDGVILDESSILKNSLGAIRNKIISAFEMTPYKLACSATPSPNDVMELGSQCEFVGAMSMTEMLSMFFTHDGSNTSKWRLKGHSEKSFWDFVSKWAVVVRSPADLGYDASQFVLPVKKYYSHLCHTDCRSIIPSGEGKLFFDDMSSMSGQSAIRKASMRDRCEIAVQIVKDNPDKIWLVWCETNDESEYLHKAIEGSVQVCGSDSASKKESNLLDFSEGKIKVLVTKPKIAGVGMNFQVCSDVIYVGLTHSFESYYQSVRRVWRYGQKNQVSIHIISHVDEGAILGNLVRKELQFESVSKVMASLAITHRTESSVSVSRMDVDYVPRKSILIPNWLVSES